ncbi:methyltransferase domain-containing protein [Myxococcota bacterium]|nr:methyltransferase domain-containing protein [Myxococcota bacterium]
MSSTTVPQLIILGALVGGCRAAAPHTEAGHGAGHGEGHGVGHGAHGADHFADPSRFVADWNSPERDAYQKPEEIVAALGLTAGQTVVDLGAGTGYLLPPLVKAVGPDGVVIATDIEQAMLTFLDEAKAKEGWTTVRTHLSPMDRLGLPDTSVDAVVTLNVWHHIEGRGAYAATVLQTLKPGGVFVIVDFLKEETEGFGPPLSMRLSAEEVVADLVAGGFEAEVVPETMPRHYVVRGRRPR